MLKYNIINRLSLLAATLAFVSKFRFSAKDTFNVFVPRGENMPLCNTEEGKIEKAIPVIGREGL
jgi:hypothetical protein